MNVTQKKHKFLSFWWYQRRRPAAQRPEETKQLPHWSTRWPISCRCLLNLRSKRFQCDCDEASVKQQDVSDGVKASERRNEHWHTSDASIFKFLHISSSQSAQRSNHSWAEFRIQAEIIRKPDVCIVSTLVFSSCVNSVSFFYGYILHFISYISFRAPDVSDQTLDLGENGTKQTPRNNSKVNKISWEEETAEPCRKQVTGRRLGWFIRVKMWRHKTRILPLVFRLTALRWTNVLQRNSCNNIWKQWHHHPVLLLTGSWDIKGLPASTVLHLLFFKMFSWFFFLLRAAALHRGNWSQSPC